MFYTVESLRREQGTGLASIHFATPIRTSALLFGKALANSLVGVVIVLANLAACLIVIGVQGKVHIELWPFALVWGLLLLPTFLLWTSFITACYSLTNNREATYGFGLAAIVGTGFLQILTTHMNWVGNWPLWGVLHWSDMGTFEFDRTALILNRVMALGLAVFFTVIAVSWFRRCDVDPGRVWTRLYPKALLKRALGRLPARTFLLCCRNRARIPGRPWFRGGRRQEGSAKTTGGRISPRGKTFRSRCSRPSMSTWIWIRSSEAFMFMARTRSPINTRSRCVGFP